jgi:thioredoxin family protein
MNKSTLVILLSAVVMASAVIGGCDPSKCCGAVRTSRTIKQGHCHDRPEQTGLIVKIGADDPPTLIGDLQGARSAVDRYSRVIDEIAEHLRTIEAMPAASAKAGTAATPAQLESARAFAAGTLAFSEGDLSPPLPAPVPPAPSPNPLPTPAPGEICQRCNGTGRIKPDGRVEIACPDCGGDGRLTLQDLVNRLNQLPPAPPTPTPTPAPKPRPNPPPSGTVQWLRTPEDGYAASKATGKQGIVFWFGQREANGAGADCPACHKFERTVLADPRVQAILAERFVCVRINATTFPESRLAIWEISNIPAVSILPPDWSLQKQLRLTGSADDFINQLNERRHWTPRRR